MRILLVAIFLFYSTSFAERVDICAYRAFTALWGNYCSYNTRPGERLIVRARQVRRDLAARWGVMHWGEVSLSRLNVRREFPESYYPLDRTIFLEKFIGLNSLVSTSVDFRQSDFMRDRGFLGLEMYSERSNLQALEPSIDTSNGDLLIPWRVNTHESFVPADVVQVSAWASSAWNRFDQPLGSWDLSQCVNRGNCQHTRRIPFSQRTPINRGHSHLVVKIDPLDRHAEFNENDGDNRRTKHLDDFFTEKVPQIMTNYSSTWDKASRMLNYWIDRDTPRIKNESIEGFDWSLRRVRFGETSWTLEQANASNGRFRAKFNELVSPSYFVTDESKTLLRNRVRERFSQNPSATSIPLTDSLGEDSRVYHSQHMRRIEGQAGGIYGYSALDAVTAALGGFSYYLVPICEAVKDGPNHYRINIRRVAVHVMDSFDFNGFQLLGCWGEPNMVSAIPFFGAKCLSNSSFRLYRFLKARGHDYNVFLTPRTVTLSNVISFRIRRT